MPLECFYEGTLQADPLIRHNAYEGQQPYDSVRAQLTGKIYVGQYASEEDATLMQDVDYLEVSDLDIAFYRREGEQNANYNVLSSVTRGDTIAGQAVLSFEIPSNAQAGRAIRKMFRFQVESAEVLERAPQRARPGRSKK